MMAQPFPAGMAQAHPGMGGSGHPMAGMQHHGAGHMGGPPGPGMMPGAAHPGVPGPQVTQGGPMVTGMPQGAGTPAPGGTMHNPMAMAHLGPQQQMFQQQNPQMFANQVPLNSQQQAMMRHQAMQRMQQAQQQGMPGGMTPNNPAFNQQMAQMRMNNMPMQQQMQMQAHAQQQNFQQQQQHQQRVMQMHAQQQAAMAAQNQQRQAQAQAQQMQMSRSQEHPTSQPPQSQPTPTPQTSQPQSQPTPQPQAAPQNKPAPTPQPQNQQAPPSQTNTPVKQNEGEEEEKIKQQEMNAMMMQEIPRERPLDGQCVLQLIMFQDSLASPARPTELEHWDDTIRKYFSPMSVFKQVLLSNRNMEYKAFGLHFPSLARFYHAHFVSGVKQILLQSYDHVQNRRQTGETQVLSNSASLTYIFNNDIRVTTQGSLNVLFDVESKIIRLDVATSNWQEYIPRNILLDSPPPEQKQSPKLNKNSKKAQQQKANAASMPNIPTAGVSEWGVPHHIVKFLEIAEVMTSMGPLIEYYHNHPGLGPRESLSRINSENQQNFNNANQARLRNQMAAATNGQAAFPNMGQGMNGPNQFASPAMQHLGLPQGQGSPYISGPVHTPSPAQNPGAGGVAMMHQMSAQGSNLSGSQGPSTNTSPNVSNKKRRQSAANLKLEDSNTEEGGNANRVKPSPRIGGKRQKGAA